MFDAYRIEDLKRKARENKPVRFKEEERKSEFSGFDSSRE